MEGRGPEMLAKLEAEDLIRILGGLPLGKEHCAQLAITALRDLLCHWRQEHRNEH